MRFNHSNEAPTGGPSFQSLYSSKRSADWPETADWMNSADHPEAAWVAWTDTVVDLRTPDARLPLPHELPDEPVHVWDSNAEGWNLTGWCWRPEKDESPGSPAPDGVSVARFTAPDGFRFSFVVSHDRPGKRPDFAYGRLSFLFPTMRLVFAGVKDTTQKELRKKNKGWVSPAVAVQAPEGFGVVLSLNDFANASQTYSLPTLRKAVEDPAAWFGTPHWQSLTFKGPHRVITADRALLSWAAAGAETFAVAEDATRAGMDAAEWATWKTAVENPSVAKGVEWNDQDIRDWFTAFGGGKNCREHALRLRGFGLTPEQAGRWKNLIGYHSVDEDTKNAMNVFDARGWVPQDVRAMNQSLLRAVEVDGFGSGWDVENSYRGVPLETVAKWSAMPAERALAYVAAGIRVVEATAFEASNPVDGDTLTMMAGLRPVLGPPPF